MRSSCKGISAFHSDGVCNSSSAQRRSRIANDDDANDESATAPDSGERESQYTLYSEQQRGT